jgi:hypothetical protein
LAPISRERAERIAKAQACGRCGEYSYKRVSVKPAPQRLQESLGIMWSAEKVCGVCDAQIEMGISDEGDVIYDS